MYAVIRTGGKQHRVEPGKSVRVEKLAGSVGDSIELSEVLLVGGDGEPRVGEQRHQQPRPPQPRCPGAHADILAHADSWPCTAGRLERQ